MLKKIVVVIPEKTILETATIFFESKRECLSVHNKTSGELVIHDVQWRNHTPKELAQMGPEEREVRKNNKLCEEEILAVFKEWIYWKKVE